MTDSNEELRTIWSQLASTQQESHVTTESGEFEAVQPDKPRVWNLRSNSATRRAGEKMPHDVVFVGRPTAWANPFTAGYDGSRTEVIAKYEAYVRSSPQMMRAIKRDLRGKHLSCFCAPLACHAMVLLRIANEE